MSNAFERLGTAKRDIKAGEPIQIRIRKEGVMSADIDLNREMLIMVGDGEGETTLGEVLKVAQNLNEKSKD